MINLDIATAPKQNSKHWKQGTITWDEVLEWRNAVSDHKESGNYLFGRLRGTLRRQDTIVSRSALTLDVDHTQPGFIDDVLMLLPWAALIHTTYSSAPDDLRYRIIIPADRDMLPDEYVAAAHSVMDLLGREQFDKTTDQPARYMFLPAAQNPDWFQSWVLDGPALPVDSLLSDFEEDLSSRPMPKPGRNKRDPFTMEGVIGAFNRAYEDIDHLVQQYELPYERVSDDRWKLAGARAVAGMGLVTPGIVFSHHESDPAGGKACSAFDLVRLHRFGDLDSEQPEQTPINRMPSHTAMLELASTDARVVAELVGVDFADDMETEAAEQHWKTKLRLHSRTGKFVDVIGNWDLVRLNDPAFQGLVYNELSLAVETTTDLPWRAITQGGEVFTSTDRAALCHYIEREYGIRAARSFIDEVVNTTAHEHFINPVKDYLDGLEWDGAQRLDVCLPGVRPTPFTRMVARKSMVAAVARMFEPGIKWDHTLVLFGSEGLGKSWWVDRMARGYSASLGRIGDKDTLITMQRSWIMVSDEGYSLKKADVDVQKEFLTRTEDVFRMPYERESVVHKRHCVIWGTTNDEVFLRRQEGNRRFLIVRCHDRVDFTAITDEYVDQVWAEAVHLYRAGEQLFLEDTESVSAAEEREQFIEEDALAGVIQEYLETLVPSDWDGMSPEARVQWAQNRSDDIVPIGDQPITRVCSAQIWVEALGKRFGDHRRTDLLDINTALKRIPGWTALPGRHRLPHYGPQLVFVRTDSIEQEMGDLI